MCRTIRAFLLFAIIPALITRYLLFLVFWGTSPRGPSNFVVDESVAFGNEQEQNTLWEVLRGDERLSKFADVIGMFHDTVLDLATPQQNLTIYAPINEAFTKEYFAPDLPSFYWLYLAYYQMGPERVTTADLSSRGTVQSFVSADVFDTYRQRISLQSSHGKVMLNHKSKLIVSPSADRAQG